MRWNQAVEWSRGRAGLPCSRPSTLISSSTSGQCNPCPVPMRRKFGRCAGVASDKRHDQASGTLITRPSAKSAMISSLVTRALRMLGSLFATVFIPRLRIASGCLRTSPRIAFNSCDLEPLL